VLRWAALMSSNTRILACIALALAVQAIPCTGQTADWEQRAEARAKEIIAKNGPGTQSALKEELMAMYERDQGVRTRMRQAGPAREREFDAELARTDRQITRELKKVVSGFGWPTVSLVGAQASQAAAVMLVHSSDNVWQKKLLPQLLQLADEEKIFGSDVAELTDRILVSQGSHNGLAPSSRRSRGK